MVRLAVIDRGSRVRRMLVTSLAHVAMAVSRLPVQMHVRPMAMPLGRDIRMDMRGAQHRPDQQ
jgi:hypothetical protein